MSTWWRIEQDYRTSQWSWSEMTRDGIVVRKSHCSFELFMDAFDDARTHGCAGMPCFDLAGESV